MTIDWLHAATMLFAIIGWVQYFRVDQYRRDVLTDLMGIVYEHDLGEDDLRRSLGYSEVDERLERWNNGYSQ